MIPFTPFTLDLINNIYSIYTIYTGMYVGEGLVVGYSLHYLQQFMYNIYIRYRIGDVWLVVERHLLHLPHFALGSGRCGS